MRWLSTISIFATLSIAFGCSRIPQGTTAAKSPVDENYVVSIAGNPETYIPGQLYNISLSAYNGLAFNGFMLALENENSANGDLNQLGTFENIDIAETRFSARCPNIVENTNTNTKTRVDVRWTAPPTIGNGCIMIRATVMQHRDVWFMDDGFLTKRICEEQIDDVNIQPTITDPCCACNEAKYELTFEGKWSRHTHPKDFPANNWRTRFSDIIGASHTVDYRFWEYGKLASEGLRKVAEHGSTKTLESELKDKSNQIRTIIKARGIAYPNVTGKTFAVFRVDSQHHLISLVSMISPSPDWIVGVSGLELCQSDCTWLENKTHNLYPWDVGTDSGPSYLSADEPQVPPDVIRRIKPNFPNDPRSPFYDPTGTPMKPLATLHISRRRLYEKTCENADSESDAEECATHTWSRWDECSANCGPGKQYRTRDFKNPTLARRSKCRNALREEQNCLGRYCGDQNAEGGETEDVHKGGGPENPECAISDWGEWSSCSVTCGTGVMMRSRHYLNPRAKKKCQKVSRARLQEKQTCDSVECGGELDHALNVESSKTDDNNDNAENSMQVDDTKSLYDHSSDRYFRNFKSYSQKLHKYIPAECGVSDWSDFSPCNAPCGGVGQRRRDRKVWNNDEVYGIRRLGNGNHDPCLNVVRTEIVNCSAAKCGSSVPAYCYEGLQVSPCRDTDVVNYWFFDHLSNQCAIFAADKCDRNHNKFNSKEACEDACVQKQHNIEHQSQKLRIERLSVDCVVSEWQDHLCNATCGGGINIKTRKVLRSPRFGGKPCPKHLVKLERCYQRCDDIYSIDSQSSGTGERRRDQLAQTKTQAKEQNECRYSEWSAWTPCTTSCGDNSVKQQTRTVINTELSYMCKDRVRIEKCVMVPCLLESDDDESDKW